MIYSPSEDSYLIEKYVRKFSKGKSVIDIGTGSGILAKSALKAGARAVTASDINPECRINNKRIKFVCSDIFKNISGRFDIIIFNPPYLPKDKREDSESALITTGGKRGDEIIVRFLQSAKNHLEKGGIILLLLSSLTPRDKINKIINKLYSSHLLLEEKKLFFETLSVIRIT